MRHVSSYAPSSWLDGLAWGCKPHTRYCQRNVPQAAEGYRDSLGVVMTIIGV